MASNSTFPFSILMSLLLVSLFLSVEGKLPQSCQRNECPTYNVIEVGNDYEIRRYVSPVWISTTPIQNKSFVGATRTGFIRLFNYVRGNNNRNKVIKLTAPVTSEVSFSDESSVVVSFYVPKENQGDPPQANGLTVQRWQSSFVAVRQFGGFVKDSNVKEEVASLKASLAGTKWSATAQKSYIVAQYDPPFKLFDRTNEIWFLYK